MERKETKRKRKTEGKKEIRKGKRGSGIEEIGKGYKSEEKKVR